MAATVTSTPTALATMADQGEVVQTSRKPRRYAIAEHQAEAAATR